MYTYGPRWETRENGEAVSEKTATKNFRTDERYCLTASKGQTNLKWNK